MLEAHAGIVGNHYDFEFPIGTVYTVPIVLTQESVDGVPVNLTGKTIVLDVFQKRTDVDDDPLFSLIEGDGLTTTPLIGEVAIRFTLAQLVAVGDEAYYRIVLTEPNTDTSVLMEGGVFVR